MLKKIFAPLFITSILASMSVGCIVHTHGVARRNDPACPKGYAYDNGRCHPRHDNGRHNGEVIVRDHRR